MANKNTKKQSAVWLKINNFGFCCQAVIILIVHLYYTERKLPKNQDSYPENFKQGPV